mmetsp:Transcript_42080/g.98702  ORF Transcript_42080/g.98702 Transcript_42080/m.98702 type:complete len:285 (+) Transcript_42080:242-1096(+)
MVRREANLRGLIKKLEGLLDELGSGEKQEEVDDGNDEFTRVKKKLATHIIEIKKAITERQDLLGSVGGGKVKDSSVAQQSQNIRKLLREVEDIYKHLQECLAKEEKDLAKAKKKTNVTPEDVEEHRTVVELYRSHIDECIELDKKRFSRETRAARKDGIKMQEITRTADGYDRSPTEIESSVSEGLTQLQRNDQALDEKLETIGRGVQRLKGIAVDQSNEVKLQGAMIDKISDNMDNATDHLNEVNQRMKETLERAGGATNIMVKVILLVLILSICAYLYKAVA